MNNSTLKKLLTEYENKRINAIQMADIRKKELYFCLLYTSPSPRDS